MKKPEPSGLFDGAEFIDAYTREQAIADGVLVDVSTTAEEAGFKIPVAITAAICARLEPSEHDAQLGQSIEGRLWDVLMVLRTKANTDADTVMFDVIVADGGEQHTLHVKSVIGPGDNAEPVVTIMFEHED
jgi:type I site-specific restriction endonuclease